MSYMSKYTWILGIVEKIKFISRKSEVSPRNLTYYESRHGIFRGRRLLEIGAHINGQKVILENGKDKIYFLVQNRRK